MKNVETVIKFIRDLYDAGHTGRAIPLHEPSISAKEHAYVEECLKSTFISSAGEFVDKFEKMTATYTGIPYAVATNNGTSALHLALKVIGVKSGDFVLTQALSFVATANAITYCGAEAIFIDSAKNNLGLCPQKLQEFLETEAVLNDQGECVHKKTSRRIHACVPMHVFGHPVQIEEIAALCLSYNLVLVEDAAEALGSFYKGEHVGHHGKVSVLSYNGNKIVTCGGGGMILTSDESLGKKIKHLSTTAKVPHAWDFVHDEIGYNYRLPNLNAAFACAQMERLPGFVEDKRQTAKAYKKFFDNLEIPFLTEPKDAKSNYWLNGVLLSDLSQRDEFLKLSNLDKIMTRPVWKLLPHLEIYENSITTSLENATYYEERIVNIPSSVRGTVC